MLGTINSLVRGEVTIHTYTSPESGLEANTHIVELPTQLLVIDTQYAVPFAAEAAAYAATLGKPITRVYVTHAHPDHFFGAAEFAAPVHALAATKSTIETNGETILSNNRATAGDVLPDKVTAPTEVVIPGEIIIDGIRLELMEFTDGEAGDALVIALPDQDVLIAQDLVYNNLHLFIAEGHLDHWLTVVGELSGVGDLHAAHPRLLGQEGVVVGLRLRCRERGVGSDDERDRHRAHPSSMISSLPSSGRTHSGPTSFWSRRGMFAPMETMTTAAKPKDRMASARPSAHRTEMRRNPAPKRTMVLLGRGRPVSGARVEGVAASSAVGCADVGGMCVTYSSNGSVRQK